LAAISAILIAFYTNSISPSSHGSFYELYAIAAAVLGGCSLRGGEGSIIGILLGTILLQVLQNLVNLLGIPSSLRSNHRESAQDPPGGLEPKFELRLIAESSPGELMARPKFRRSSIVTAA